jgi:UTP:GlnB (protein PII) uridylyltransferase
MRHCGIGKGDTEMIKITITTSDGEILDSFVVETARGDEIENARALRKQLEMRNNVADTEAELYIED